MSWIVWDSLTSGQGVPRSGSAALGAPTPRDWSCSPSRGHPAPAPRARQGVPAKEAERERRGEQRREDIEREKKKNNKVGERREKQQSINDLNQTHQYNCKTF